MPARMTTMIIRDHQLMGAEQVPSPNQDERPAGEVSLIVIHNISLPAGHFGTPYVPALFTNQLTQVHPDFSDLQTLRVSSHLLVRRDGQVVQFVNFDKRAWHAGESNFNGRQVCNDFSVGIELEGTDHQPYRDEQYRTLVDVCAALLHAYEIPTGHITGHEDIAPGRKTDPGPAFDWGNFRDLLTKRLE